MLEKREKLIKRVTDLDASNALNKLWIAIATEDYLTIMNLVQLNPTYMRSQIAIEGVQHTPLQFAATALLQDSIRYVAHAEELSAVLMLAPSSPLNRFAIAIAKNDRDGIAQALEEEKSSLNCKLCNRSPLSFAVLHNLHESVKCLIQEHKVDPYTLFTIRPGEDGLPGLTSDILKQTTYAGNPIDMFQLLTSIGVHYEESKSSEGYTTNNLEFHNSLTKLGIKCDILGNNCVSYVGASRFDATSCNQNISIFISYLLGNSDNACKHDQYGKYPLLQVMQWNRGQDLSLYAKALMTAGAQLDAIYDMTTPLIQSIVSIESLTLCLSLKPDVNLKDASGKTPLHHIKELEILKYFLQHAKPNLDAQDNDGNTKLHYVMKEGKVNTASILIQAGADINIQNNNGTKPLEQDDIDADIAWLIQSAYNHLHPDNTMDVIGEIE